MLSDAAHLSTALPLASVPAPRETADIGGGQVVRDRASAGNRTIDDKIVFGKFAGSVCCGMMLLSERA